MKVPSGSIALRYDQSKKGNSASGTMGCLLVCPSLSRRDWIDDDDGRRSKRKALMSLPHPALEGYL